MKKTLLVCALILCTMPIWAQDEPVFYADPIDVYAHQNTDTDQLEADLNAEIKDINNRLGVNSGAGQGEEAAQSAPDAAAEDTEEAQADGTEEAQAEAEPAEIIPTPLQPEKQQIRLKNRGFEIALAGINVGAYNSLFTAGQVFKKTMVLNLDDLSNGIKIGFYADIAPLAININWRDQWGFGFDLGTVSVFGNVGISDKLLQIQKADKEKFGAGGAVFVDAGIPVFFHIRKLKINLRPAVYMPVAYAEPGLTYTFTDKGDGLYMAVNYDMYVYTPISLENINSGSFDYMQVLNTLNTGTFGFDFSAGFEFPLFSWLDAGINLKNIPLKTSTLRHYMRLQGEAYVDTSVIDIGDLINGGSFPDDAYGVPDKFEPEYGKCKRQILRPFKFVPYAAYRPLNTPLLSLLPELGIAVNPLYPKPVSLEAGLKFRVDLANMLITTIGINYEDQIWKNSFALGINLRAFEIDTGIALTSSNFAKSWGGAGVNFSFVMKLGW